MYIYLYVYMYTYIHNYLCTYVYVYISCSTLELTYILCSVHGSVFYKYTDSCGYAPRKEVVCSREPKAPRRQQAPSSRDT